MSFWDSQILGVIVGALAGGVGKVIYDIRAKNQLCEKLERGIKAEAKVLKEAFDPVLDAFTEYFEDIRAGKKYKDKYKSLPLPKMSFTEANLREIGALDKEFVEPLIEVRARLEVLPKLFKTMWKTQNEFADCDETKRSPLIKLLNSAIEALKIISENCQKLLNHESNYSTIDTVIRFCKNKACSKKRKSGRR